MNEAKIVQRIIKDLKRSLPGAIIFKHNDLSTAGIPDISINYRLRTVWLEVKYLRANESRSKAFKHFDKLQLASNMLLDRQVPVFYLVAYETFSGITSGLKAFLYRPEYLKKFLENPDLSAATTSDASSRKDVTVFVGTRFGRLFDYVSFGALENVVEIVAGIVRKES